MCEADQMETTYTIRQEYRSMARYTPAVAVLNLAIMASLAATIVWDIVAGGEMSAKSGLPVWLSLSVLVIWGGSCVCLMLWSRHCARYTVGLSEGSIRMGDVSLTWDQVALVVHRPSKLFAIEFRVITRDGRKVDVWHIVQDADQIESFVRSKL